MTQCARQVGIVSLFFLIFFLDFSASAAPLVDIQSAVKSRITGWAFARGAGTRIALAIEVKFKVNCTGVVELPVFAVYLYDQYKNPVGKITNFLLKKGTRYEDSYSKYFKGNKTHVVAFPYANTTKFKYFLAVAGRQGNVSAKVMPKGAILEEFAYDEKGQT